MKKYLYLNPCQISYRNDVITPVSCKNLRLSDNGDGTLALTVVGQPEKLVSGDYVPIAACRRGRQPSYTVFVKHERTLYTMMANEGELTELCTFDSDILHAFVCLDFVLIVTDTGSYHVYFDYENDVWRSPVIDDDYRAVSLHAVDAGLLQQTIAARELSTYKNAGAIEVSDLQDIERDLLTAYRQLALSARQTGVLFQPALCRYRLRDEQGRELFTSPAVLLGPSCGQQFGEAFKVGGTDRYLLNAYSLDALTWRFRLDIAATAMPSDERVATLEVLMSPQLHPFDNYGFSIYAHTLRLDSDDSFMSIAFNNPLEAETVKLLAARMDCMERVVATVNRPFADGAARSIDLDVTDVFMPTEENKSIDKALKTNINRVDSLSARLLPPHRFTATTASTASGVTLWGNIKAERYAGYPLSIFATATANKPWRAAVKVEFADGSEVAVWQGQATTGCPTAINPILSYPSADAVKMTIMLSASGQSPMKQSFDLMPDETGTCARYISSDLKPFVLAASSEPFVIPADNAVELELPGVIVAADAANPMAAKAVQLIDSDFVTAIAPARVGQNAWDFGRSRFYVMTRQGINSVAVNAARTAISVNLIDQRGVDSDTAVTVADDDVVVAAANGDLLALRASRINTIRADTGYKQLAWVAEKRELWGVDSSGKVEVVCFDYDKTGYERSDLTIKTVLNHSGGTLAQTDSGIVDICSEKISLSRSVKCSITVSPRDLDLFSPTALRVDMAAMRINGTVSLSRVGLTTTPNAPDVSAQISGELRSPLNIRPLARPMRRVTFTVEADVSSDFHLAGCLLNYTY
jgi:hypothetical protein